MCVCLFIHIFFDANLQILLGLSTSINSKSNFMCYFPHKAHLIAQIAPKCAIIENQMLITFAHPPRNTTLEQCTRPFTKWKI